MAVRIFTVTEGEFSEYMKRPLISGDIGAYKIILKTAYDLSNHSARVTAKRSDGVILEDAGTIIGSNVEYTMKSSIYNTVGEVEIRIVIADSQGNCLTEKSLIFDVEKNHLSGDMEQATDSGKSISDLAMAHIYNTDNPHGITAEKLGLGSVVSELSGKLDYKIVDTLPAASADVCNCLYLLLQTADNYDPIDNQAWIYDAYICCPSYSTGGAPYTWTLLGRDVVDSSPVLGSTNPVSSDGVARYNKATYRTAGKGWYRIAVSEKNSLGDCAVINVAKNFSRSKPDSIVFSVTTRYKNTPSITQLNRVYGDNTILKCRIVYSTTAEVQQYIDIWYDTDLENALKFNISSYGWSLYQTAQRVDDTVPEGYASYEFEFSDSGIKAEKITAGNVDTTPTSGSNNFVTSGGVATALDDKLDNLPASSSKYDTGRVWLNGAPIIRRDFAYKIPYTSPLIDWSNKFINIANTSLFYMLNGVNVINFDFHIFGGYDTANSNNETGYIALEYCLGGDVSGHIITFDTPDVVAPDDQTYLVIVGYSEGVIDPVEASVIKTLD